MCGLPTIWLLLLAVLNTHQYVESSDFEPYQLNGGLVSAVSGKGFVVIASDTRFMGEGNYDILSRDHITSRLWMANPPGNSAEPSPFTRLLQKKEPKTTTTGVESPMSSLSFVVPRRVAPTFVGSSGCNADCEQLKRTVQAELRSAVYFGECGGNPPADQVATLLSQILYGRRGFPFYSFCIVAGLSTVDDGQVYVYDAIGSYEQVAVACTGTGRELLQPILDRKFRTALQKTATGAKRQAVATTTTVPTQVDCTFQEAVNTLIDAYQSVSEREIGVGDNLVICVVEQHTESNEKRENDSVQCHVYKVPLKMH